MVVGDFYTKNGKKEECHRCISRNDTWVNRVEEYRWSSYNAYINTNTEYTRIIGRSRVLEMFSTNSIEKAQEPFKEFMTQNSDDRFIECEDTIKINKVKEKWTGKSSPCPSMRGID